MNKRIKIAIVGYRNVGRGVHKAIEKNPDTILSGIITRRPEQVEKEVKGVAVYHLDKEPSRWKACMNADVAVLCGGSKNDIPKQGPSFLQYFNTVDSFDTHIDIPKYFAQMDKVAKESKHISILSVGWDPGIFSLERVLTNSVLPACKQYTFWGPGVSQGHSDAARTIDGVIDARQYTIPVKEAIEKVRKGETPNFTKREMHTRLVYVVAKEGADKERIKEDIIKMPKYYEEYNTEVKFITKEQMERDHSKYSHGGFVVSSGLTGDNKEITEYSCKLESNPEFTGSILIAYARAAYRLNSEGKKGAFTALDIPASYLSPHSAETLREKFL